MNDKKSILDEVISSRDEQVLQSFDPASAVSALLKSIDSRGANVIIQRYSLDGRPSRTLEEIGQNYGVTRERIRQIESATVKELQDKQDSLNDIAQVIVAVLKENGHVMEENHLVDTLMADREHKASDRSATLFVLELHDDFRDFDETDHTHRSWGTKEADLDTTKELVEAFAEVLGRKKQTVAREDVLSYLKDHPVYSKHSDRIDDNSAVAYLTVSKKVKRNPFDEWGLSHWPQVSPRGVKDKAFVVLNKTGKPLHFVEIAKQIDKSGFDNKKAHPQTVHNELIKDKRFVLVGRGIYALVEWGFEPGTVADVLASVLGERDEPMTKDDLIEEVLKRRLVKRNTVLLGLQNKERFTKLPDGRYTMQKRA